MFPKQRILRFGVVKVVLNGVARYRVPPFRRMTRFTASREFALVGIGMAIGTAGKLQARPIWTSISSRSVTFSAGDLNVQPGQREASAGMIEICERLPISRVVTLLAGRSKATLVRILMA
jgi:hypothetical protein